jgi:hypothetical protein
MAERLISESRWGWRCRAFSFLKDGLGRSAGAMGARLGESRLKSPNSVGPARMLTEIPGKSDQR